MLLNSDIGIDIDGLMYILFKKDCEIPNEETFIIELYKNNPILNFYQGQRVYVKDNKLIGMIELINNTIGKFELICNILDDKLIIKNNENEYIFVFVNDCINEKNDEEEIIRNLENAKIKYICYVKQTLHTLEQIKDKIDPILINKIKEALDIIYIDNVTENEYELAQQQIESWVNPKLKKLI